MTMTFTKTDGSSVTHTYRYDGYKILTYSSGKKGVRYLFTATDSQAADNPYQYVQFSDHQIDPTSSAHFHIFFGNSSQEEILKETGQLTTLENLAALKLHKKWSVTKSIKSLI